MMTAVASLSPSDMTFSLLTSSALSSSLSTSLTTATADLDLIFLKW